MFEYFPTNYIWSLGVAATLNSGGAIDEVDRACRPIRDAAARGDAGTRDLMLAWKAVADQVAEQAREAEAAGHLRTAGQKYFRSAVYVCQAERMLSSKDPERIPFYQQGLDAMQKSFDLVDPATTRVAIPFEGPKVDELPAYFLKAARADGTPAPTMIMWNGLDSTKEHMYTSGWPQELAQRGISTLMVDCPGSGEALRFRGLTSRVETEDWAGACVDFLETRADVDHERIGLVGWSLGGYYAPRAAAFEKRIKLSSRGAPTTTGARCRSAGSSARARTRSRTTGSTCCGSGGTTMSRRSSRPRPTCTSTGSSSRSPCRS